MGNGNVFSGNMAVVGRVCPVLQGEYDESKSYERLDFVTRMGSLFGAKKAVQGHAPPDEEYWQLLCAAGQTAETTPVGAIPGMLPSGVHDLAGALKYLGCPRVGGLHISGNDEHPAQIWPGTVWTKVEAGRFLTAAGDGYALGSTGGSKTHKHALKDAYAAIKVETTDVYAGPTVAGGGFNINVHKSGFGGSGGGWWCNDGVAVYGGTKDAESLPPYLALNIWRRTA